jgi:glycosyltransferase involved in cell wall biosynthesis
VSQTDDSSTRTHSLAGLYDAEYYAHHLGQQPYDWSEGAWVEFFGRVADAIVAELAPATVLDAGCGIGFLVDALRKRSVEAYGFDISEYAISQVPDELQSYCWVASVTEELDRDYDLIVCTEVLEHLPPDLVEDAIGNLTRHTGQILFSSTPSDFAEPTHYSVRPLESWIDLFARRGFFRNVDLDASFVAPHAVHLVRSEGTAAAVARDYERWHWRHRAELIRLREDARKAADAEARSDALARDLREAELEAELLRHEAHKWRDQADLAAAELAEWNAFRGRSGYRIFLRFANLRSKLAPPGTRRDRLVRSLLRTVAGALDRRTGQTPLSRPGLGAVLVVSACPGDAKRYRRDHQAAELALAGVTVDVIDDSEVDLDDALGRYGSFILHRVPWGLDVERFMRDARDRGKPVLFDTDDLVFEPEAQRHVKALLEMDEDERTRFSHSLRRLQRTLEACDGALVSTEPLRKAASRYNANIEVAYNVASDEMTRQADAAVASRRARESETVTIAYFSGTATHNVDFAEAADAVLWALETYPNVHFLAVGLLTLDPRFDAYAERVERVPLQPWQRLPELLARTDVNLAPLEPRNPFTDGKSCIKYIEAGLVGTPTIASPRSDFVRAIEHGRNGLLADSPDEWREAIRTLVESPEQREEIGRAAFADVRANHTVRARSMHLLRSVATLVRPDEAAPLTVNFVVDAPVVGDGAVFRLADHLGRQGHRVRVYVDSDERRGESSSPEVEIHVGHAEIAAADVTIATSAATASTVAAHDLSLFKLYLVAGLEPGDESDALPLRRVGVDEEQGGAELELILRETCFVRLPPAAA